MELRQLCYFVVVVEELYFGCVVKCLFILQLVLSFDICKFEDVFGVQLFLCINKMVVLINVGEVLFGEVCWLLLQVVEVECLMVCFVLGFVGWLWIGFVYLMLYCGLFDVVWCFEVDYLGVEVVLSEMNMYVQVQVIQCGQIDFGYVYWGYFLFEVELVFVYVELFVCCLLVVYLLVWCRQVVFVMFVIELFILFLCDVVLYYYDLIIVQCVNVGFSLLICYEVWLWQMILLMIEFGMGIVLVLCVLQQVKSDWFVFLLLKDVLFELCMFVLKCSGIVELVVLCFVGYVCVLIDVLFVLVG